MLDTFYISRKAAITLCLSALGAVVLSGCGADAGTGSPGANQEGGQGSPKSVRQADTLHPLGALKDSSALMTAHRLTSTAPPGGLPPTADMISQFPPPGDQEGENSCVGWAVAYAAKSFHETVEDGWSPTTANHQFSAAWLYNQINGGADGGSYISAAMDLIVSKGADTFSSFPYVNGDYLTQPSAVSMQRAARFPALSWNTLSVSETSFKNVLAGHNAIVIGFEVLPDYDGLNGSTNTVYDSDAGASRGRHANTIIGYDDYRHAFHIMNSWGTWWGDGGYGWLDYSFITNSKLALDAYVLVDGPNWPLVGDANGDKCVDNADYQILSASYGYSIASGHADPDADFNHDGWVDQLDYGLMVQHWNEGC